MPVGLYAEGLLGGRGVRVRPCASLGAAEARAQSGESRWPVQGPEDALWCVSLRQRVGGEEEESVLLALTL